MSILSSKSSHDSSSNEFNGQRIQIDLAKIVIKITKLQTDMMNGGNGMNTRFWKPRKTS